MKNFATQFEIRSHKSPFIKPVAETSFKQIASNLNLTA